MYPVPELLTPAPFIDSHAHYNDRRFEGFVHELLEKQKSMGVKAIINCGCDFTSIDACLQLGKKYDFCYTAVGFHPENLPDGDIDVSTLAEIAKREDKVCAIGEIGLDYYWNSDNKQQQKKALCDQLDLAKDLNLPAILHDRDAHGDMLDIIRQHKPRGVVHCFSGSPEMAKEVVDLGLYIGVGGVITFKNAKKLIEVVRETPIERLLLETDAPYLAPEPFRGKINHSALIIYVAQKIAEIKNLPLETVLQITTQNTCELFGI